MCRTVGNFGEQKIWQNGSHLVLAEFKFGDLNDHAALNLATFEKFAKLPNLANLIILPNFPPLRSSGA